MTQPRPRPAPKLPVSLAANPRLSSWLRFSAGRPGDGLAGKGRDRARHRHGAGPDCRRRTRCRYRPRADGSRLDGGQPQRGRHLGQPFRAAIRPRHTAGLRRSPANLPGAGVGSSGRRHRRARGRGWHHLRSRQCQDQLLGTRGTRFTGSRRDAGRHAPKPSAQRTLAGKSVQRLDIPDKVFAHPRFIHDADPARDAAWPGAAVGECRRRNSSA